MSKIRDLAVLWFGDGAKDPPGHDLESFVRRVGAGATDQAILDLPHPSAEARQRFDFDFPIQIDALAWLPAGAPLPDAWSASFEESFRYTVSCVLAWEAPSEDEATADSPKSPHLVPCGAVNPPSPVDRRKPNRAEAGDSGRIAGFAISGAQSSLQQ